MAYQLIKNLARAAQIAGALQEIEGKIAGIQFVGGIDRNDADIDISGLFVYSRRIV